MGKILDLAQSAINKDSLISSQDMGKILRETLEDGKITWSEKRDLAKIADDFVDSLTPAARRALDKFLDLPPHLAGNLMGEIFSADEGTSELLENAEITTPFDLLLKTRSPADRQWLSNKTSVDATKLTELAEQVDLARTCGIGKRYAAVLQGVGINTVQELASANATELHQKIVELLKTDEGREISRRAPALKSVAKWIDRANDLPVMLVHDDNEDPEGKTLTAFNALSSEEKDDIIHGFNDGWNGVITEDYPSESELPLHVQSFIEDLKAHPGNHLPTDFGDREMRYYGSFDVDQIWRAKLRDADVLGYAIVGQVLGNAVSENGEEEECRCMLDLSIDAQGNIIKSYMDTDHV